MSVQQGVDLTNPLASPDPNGEWKEKLLYLAENKPLAHPIAFELRFFDYSTFPGRHLREWYQALYEGAKKEEAIKNKAAIMPRGRGKTESTTVVWPSWLLCRFPHLKVAVIAHKKGIANDRTKKLVRRMEELAPHFDIDVVDSGKTHLRLGPNDDLAGTVESHSIKSDIEGKHFDVVIYDDIATYANMTTAERSTVISKFQDHVDNLGDDDTSMPGGPMNVVIGTRKHEDDVYRVECLDSNEHDWQGCVALDEGSFGWDTRVYRALDDWTVIENGAYKLKGTDGAWYSSVSDMKAAGVSPVNNGVRLTQECRALWPGFASSEETVYEILTGDSSSSIWKRENMSDPTAGQGEILEIDWLGFTERLEKDWDHYQWYAGLDFANPDNRDAEMRGDTDYWGLTVLAHDKQQEVSYVFPPWRNRKLTWSMAATDFVGPKLQQYPVGELIIESNFSGGEIADTIKDELEDDPNLELGSLKIRKSDSSGEKEDRLYALGNKFQQGKCVCVGSPEDERWESFIQDEWVTHPDQTHDDRFDSIEIARRGIGKGNTFLDPEDDLPNITWE